MPTDDRGNAIERLPAVEIERLVASQLAERYLPVVVMEEELPRVVAPLRGLIELERRSLRAGADERGLRVEVRSQSGAVAPLAPLLGGIDREMRRVPPLLEAVRRREPLVALPRPEPARHAGLRIVRADTGSVDLSLEVYGPLVALATTGPIAIISAVQTLWSLGKLPRSVFRTWAIVHDKRRREITSGIAESPHLLVKELVKVSRDAIKAGDDQVSFEVSGPDIEVRFVATRTRR